MVSFTKLAELSSGNAGFAGGYGYDMAPRMSFTEAADAFSMELMEDAIAYFEEDQRHDDALFEAAIDALQSGDKSILESAYEEIVEASGESILEKIKNAFKKLKNWLMTLINKIKVWIDAHIKDGQAFWEKYGRVLTDSSKVNGSVEIQGYDLGAAVKNTADKCEKGVSLPIELIKEVTPKAFSLKEMPADDETIKEATTAVSGTQVADLRKKIYSKAGLDPEKKVQEQLLGKVEKRIIKASDVNTVIRPALLSAKEAQIAQNMYKASLQLVENEERSINASLQGDTKIAYGSAWVKLLNSAVAECNKFVNEVVKVSKIISNEAKKAANALMTGKDTSKKDEKSKTEAFGIDDFGIDFEW